ncbi:MAG: hypothetical protein EA358_10585, partial [Flavobacteriales bacterium]
ANCGSTTVAGTNNVTSFQIGVAVNSNNQYPNDVSVPGTCNTAVAATAFDTLVVRPGTTLTFTGNPSVVGVDGLVLVVYGTVNWTGGNANARRRANFQLGSTTIIKPGGAFNISANQNKDITIDGVLIIESGGVLNAGSAVGGDNFTINGDGVLQLDGVLIANSLTNDGAIVGTGDISTATSSGSGTVNGVPDPPTSGSLSEVGPTWNGTSWTPSPANGLTAIINISGGNPFTALQNIVVSSLNVKANATMDPNQNINISNNLILDDGVTLTLGASLAGYSMLKFGGETEFGTGASVVQQQNLPGGWHMVSAPMNATNAGFFGGIGTQAANGNNNTQNFFSWNGSDFVNLANNSAAIQAGRGYYGFVGNFGFQDPGVHPFSGTPNTSVTFPSLTPSNTEALTNVTVDGTNGRFGWSMLGNPFTCALDFSSLSTNDIEDAFYIFDPSAGSDGEFVSVSGAGLGTTFIAPLQAFWVRSTGANPSLGTATMSANGTVSSSPDFLRTGNTFDRVVLRSTEVANPNFKDHTVIALIENTTDGFDNGWDARKMMPSENTPGIYTIGNAEGLANNAIDYGPNRSDKKSIDLAFRASKQGANYSIRFDEDFMVNEYTIYLEDKLLGQFHDLKSGDYVFANDTNNRERFVVHFRSGALSSDLEFANAANLRAWVYENTAYIHPNVDLGRSDIRMMDMSGRTVFNTSADLHKNERYDIALPQLKAGVYLLQVGGQKVVKVVLR